VFPFSFTPILEQIECLLGGSHRIVLHRHLHSKGTDSLTPCVWYGTQGPSDLLHTPPGFVVVEKALNNTDIYGIKQVVVATGMPQAAANLSAFASATEPVQVAMRAFLQKLSKSNLGMDVDHVPGGGPKSAEEETKEAEEAAKKAEDAAKKAEEEAAKKAEDVAKKAEEEAAKAAKEAEDAAAKAKENEDKRVQG